VREKRQRWGLQLQRVRQGGKVRGVVREKRQRRGLHPSKKKKQQEEKKKQKQEDKKKQKEEKDVRYHDLQQKRGENSPRFI
jgi:hypothetical protein